MNPLGSYKQQSEWTSPTKNSMIDEPIGINRKTLTRANDEQMQTSPAACVASGEVN
jgi:hypothetical protein